MKFTFVYPILLCILPTRGDKICSTSSHDPTCPTDCSQNDTRVQGESSKFNCTIGGIDYIKRYKKFKSAYFQPETEPIFEAPTLLNIEFYRRKDPYRNFADNPSLKINFLIPKGVEPKGYHDIIYPEAILMKFESIADTLYMDWFYYHCPRYRIFHFHDYAPQSSYEALNPRNISFDCLVGLNDTASYQLRVYKIKLETVQGQFATYMVTVNVVADLLDEAHWQTVIAVHVDENRHTVYVVFQKLLKSHVYGYVVELAKADTVVQSKKLPPMNNTVFFENVVAGTFYVKVSAKSRICPKDDVCMTTTSYIIDMPGQKDFGEDHMKIIVMVLGCLLGVMLVLLLFGWIWMRLHKIKEKPIQGWLIHPFQYDTEQFDVVEKFTESLEDMCQCHVQKFMPGESNEMVGKEELEVWCSNTLNKHVKFVVIVHSESAFAEIMECTYNNFYSYAIQNAVHKKKSKNDLRIFVVIFPFTKSQLPQLLKECMVFNLMDDFMNICTEIQNLSHHAESANEPLLSCKRDTVQTLKLAVENVKTKRHSEPTEHSQTVDNPETKAECIIEVVKNKEQKKNTCDVKNILNDLSKLTMALNASDSDEDLDSDDDDDCIQMDDNGYVPHKTAFIGQDNNEFGLFSSMDKSNMHCVQDRKTIINNDYLSHKTMCVDQGHNDHTVQNLSSTQTKDEQNMHCPQHVKTSINNDYVPHDTVCVGKDSYGHSAQNLSSPKAKDGQNMHCPQHVKTTMNNDYVPHDTVCVGKDSYGHAPQNLSPTPTKNEQNIYYQDYVKTTVDDYVPHETLEMSDGIVKPKVYGYPKSGGHGKHVGKDIQKPSNRQKTKQKGTNDMSKQTVNFSDGQDYICDSYQTDSKTMWVSSSTSSNHQWPPSNVQSYQTQPAYIEKHHQNMDHQLSYLPTNPIIHVPPHSHTSGTFDVEMTDAGIDHYDGSINFVQGLPNHSYHSASGRTEFKHGHIPRSSNPSSHDYVQHSDVYPYPQQENQSHVHLPQYLQHKHETQSGDECLDYHGSPHPSLQSASQQHWLQTGSQQPCFRTGSQQPCLQTSSQQPRLQTGSRQPCLRTGSQQPCLRTGSQQPCLRTGSQQPCLRTGSQQPCLQTDSPHPCLWTGSQQPCLQTDSHIHSLSSNDTERYDTSSFSNVLSPNSSLSYETSFSEPDQSLTLPYNMPISNKDSFGYVSHTMDKQGWEPDQQGWEPNQQGWEPDNQGWEPDQSWTDNEISFPAVDPTALEQSSVNNDKDKQSHMNYDDFDPIPPDDNISPEGSIDDLVDKIESIN